MRNNISNIRKHLEITQQELANAIGVSRQSISSIEREVHNPSLKIANDIAIFLDFPLESVFDITEEIKDDRPIEEQIISAMKAIVIGLSVTKMFTEILTEIDEEEESDSYKLDLIRKETICFSTGDVKSKDVVKFCEILSNIMNGE